MTKLTLEQAIADYEEMIESLADDAPIAVSFIVGKKASLEDVLDGEIVHPHTAALARVSIERSDDFSVTEWEACQVCGAWARQEGYSGDDIVLEHASDCAWVQAKEWTA